MIDSVASHGYHVSLISPARDVARDCGRTPLQLSLMSPAARVHLENRFAVKAENCRSHR